ncbi:hypothetical protein ACFOFO_23610 [Undibacterium arcticum]|uniref:Uncharacterized protein n=1 Tax=Undibacterium arcticum TaxID=1762892 RepID=A0ABV7F719_9BURK
MFLVEAVVTLVEPATHRIDCIVAFVAGALSGHQLAQSRANVDHALDALALLLILVIDKFIVAVI